MPGVSESSLMVRGCASNVVNYESFIMAENVGEFFIERGKLAMAEVLN